MPHFVTSFFRAIPEEAILPEVMNKRDTVRVPSNIPYVVDNLWEWLRPESYPSRRHAVFASPSYRQAIESARGGRSGPSYRPYHVTLLGNCTLAYLAHYQDAKLHPDVYTLPRILFEAIGAEWVGQPLAFKQRLGLIFLPCLAKSEMESILGTPELANLATALRQTCSYWDDVDLVALDALIEGNGELYFEPPPEGYCLTPLAEHEENQIRQAFESNIAELLAEAEELGQLEMEPLDLNEFLKELEQEIQSTDEAERKRAELFRALAIKLPPEADRM